MTNKLHLFLCIALLALSGSNIAFAQPKPDKKPGVDPVVYEGDYEELESYGVYSRPADGSLGRDLWSNSSRSALMYWFKNMPEQFENPMLQRIAFGTLLSRVNANLIRDDIDVVPGEDLLTLRLEQLLKMGAYSHAAELYSKADDEAYHPRLAYTGALALLLSGDKGLACLDVKTNLESFANDGKLNMVSAYCDLHTGKEQHKTARKVLNQTKFPILHAIAKDKNYKTSYSAGRFSALDPFELAALVADKRVRPVSFKSIASKNIPPQHLIFLLNDEKLSENAQFTLTERAVYWGLLPAKDLKPFIEDQKTVENPSTLRQKLGNAYHAVGKAARGTEQWSVLATKLFPQVRKYGPHIGAPFIDILRDASPKNSSFGNLRTGLSILAYSGQEAPASWAKSLKGRTPKGAKEQRLYDSVATALYVNASRYKRDDLDYLLKHTSWSGKSSAKGAKASSLKDLADRAHAAISGDNRKNTFYEKRIPLTLPRDYVMPTYQVWDRLNYASDKGSIGEVVLLCLNILRSHGPQKASGKNIGTLYPGVMRDILDSLDSVGLTNISRDLATELALEQ